MQRENEFAVYPEWVYEGGSGDANLHLCKDKFHLIKEIINLLTDYDSPKELYSIEIRNLHHWDRNKNKKKT